jgi:hypothetical protein
LADPPANALAAAVLLAAFIGTGSSFLAFAVLAERRGLKSLAYPTKGLYYLGGLTEAGETLACFTWMCLWPAAFAPLALGFAALCALTVLARLRAGWLEGQGDVLLVAIAAPVPLIDGPTAVGAATSNRALEAPVLDVAIPRRLKPSFGGVSYSALRRGWIEVEGHRLRVLPAHSPRLAMEIGAELAQQLVAGRFPLRLPLRPLGERPGLRPLDP